MVAHPPTSSFEPLESRTMLAGEAWGNWPQLINLDDLVTQRPQIDGRGQVVVVIDTGVDYRHPALGGAWGVKVIDGWDFVDNDADPMDHNGHGTGIAGVMAASEYIYKGNRYQGIAPGAKIIALRVDDDSTRRNQLNTRIEQALQWVIARLGQYNIAAINFSISTSQGSTPISLDPFGDELTYLAQRGVFISAASGNENSITSIDYPAIHPDVWAIGSVTTTDVISSFTDRNAHLDLLTPGENIAIPYYDAARNSHIYLLGTGTSFAAPMAAGAAALLRQINPDLSAYDIIDLLKSTGVNNFDGDKETGKVSGLTFKRLDINAAVTAAIRAMDDQYEENDSIGTAPTVATFGSSGGSISLTGLKLAAGDHDYFRFVVNHPGRITFSFSAAGAPALHLLSSSGGKIADIANGSFTDLDTGVYFVRVNAMASNLPGTYTLGLDATPDDIQENNSTPDRAVPINSSAQLSGLRLLGGNADYFRFNLSARSAVTVSLGLAALGGSPTAELLNASQQQVQALSAGENRLTLPAGAYYIRLVSPQTLSGTYTLGYSATLAGPPAMRGSFNDIAVDASGTMHLAYYDRKQKVLKYVTRDRNGVWSSIRTIDSASNVGQYVSLALDHNGRAAVAYYDAANGDLKYAIQDGGSFLVSLVDGTRVTGLYPSLAFNNKNRPVISYYNKSRGDLMLAQVNATGKWSFTTIDSKGDTGLHPSLALNPSTGRFAIAYLDQTRTAFKFAENTKKSNWAIKVVDDRKGGSGISLAFGKQGQAAFSYYDAAAGDLRLAQRTGGKWLVSTVAAKGNTGISSNLIFAGATPSVIYYDATQQNILQSTLQKGRWKTTKLASAKAANISAAFGGFSTRMIVFEDGKTGLIGELAV